MSNEPTTGALSSALVWKASPIYLSSTFRDMRTERDCLRGRAFLPLGEQLRERCHYLDTIDLRQGVENAPATDEARREMQVLKVCLDEIERSKPFLVALLGERYGWVPPAERITAAARATGLPASLDVTGKSATDRKESVKWREQTDGDGPSERLETSRPFVAQGSESGVPNRSCPERLRMARELVFLLMMLLFVTVGLVVIYWNPTEDPGILVMRRRLHFGLLFALGWFGAGALLIRHFAAAPSASRKPTDS